eukprot:gnl/TRDRNA2_/TRDRNA2_194949_c0_seq1.p1 gnl/TRDRNA2_/TRDRNA2_194949_c0~~gnl/TRDRNA2_/TRDRNA2_194949_c0_seq1.p1  ORF type:complete len:198 (+),score=23.03 gnl/TRDRNA2_/TRDRNA2_194949_c0_seq1:88-681(+)
MSYSAHAENQVGGAQYDWAKRWQLPDATGSDGRTDLCGLLRMLDDLRSRGVWLAEVQYVVNNWNFAGFIPMSHHGLVFRTSACTFFSLDFGRRGISWDTFAEEPHLPDGTIFERRFPISRAYSDPARLKKYCAATEEFSFFRNDCEKWTAGALQEVGLRDADDAYTAEHDALVNEVGEFDHILSHHKQSAIACGGPC